MGKIWTVLKWLIGIGLVLGVIIMIAAFVYVLRTTKDLPSIKVLSEYSPPVMSRVHAGDGKLISEFRTEARVFVPIETIPEKLQHAFVAAEDQRFYTHDGFDEKGFARAMVANIGHVLNDRRLEGGSTLTQQVAKNFLVGSERSVERKVREVFIARRIEKAMSKDKILELYLNDIYFGRSAYGVAAASLNYFGKPMKELSLAETAYLAVLPRAPSNYQVTDPVKKKRALARRDYVLSRMVEDGYASKTDADAARATDIVVTDRLAGEEYLAAEYFVEEARKQIYQMYGQEELYSGGLSIRTTLDTDMQLAGRKALRRGLEMFDRRHGYRGPLEGWGSADDWKSKLRDYDKPADTEAWRLAVVLDVADKSATLGFVSADEDEALPEGDDRGTMALSDIDWAGKALPKGKVGNKPGSVKEIVKTGDVILVQRKAAKKDGTPSTEYNLRQIPKVNGGLIAMDPHTGRVLTLIGGYSFEQSEFNRVTQAYRQPGSAFKPFVYAAALQNGFTPASQVLDAPFVIERQDVECEENELGALELRGSGEDRDADLANTDTDECERFYKPSNYNAGKFYGMSTLRLGLEKSRNAMTVRLANEIGMTPVNRMAREFGIYDETKPELAWALGAGETNLLRLASAYSTMINGGKQVTPTILDRVQAWDGTTVFQHGEVRCETCQQESYTGGRPPELPDLREQIIDPVTAYQVTFMMQGVVENGTGFRMKALERPVGGKTGTTNDSVDTWFMGFSPDLVVGVYVGMDTPEQMGLETGSSAAAPIVTDFMKTVLADKAKVPFRIPEGVTLAPVNRVSGEPSFIGAPDFILEAFRPGTEPSLGGLSTTIRVGSGSDTIGFGSNFSSRSDDKEVAEADVKTTSEGDETKRPGEDATDKAERPKPETEEGDQEDRQTSPDAKDESPNETVAEGPKASEDGVVPNVGPDAPAADPDRVNPQAPKPQEGDPDSVDPGAVGSADPQEVAPKPLPVRAPVPVTPKPEPKPKPKDELDDGLY